MESVFAFVCLRINPSWASWAMYSRMYSRSPVAPQRESKARLDQVAVAGGRMVVVPCQAVVARQDQDQDQMDVPQTQC